MVDEAKDKTLALNVVRDIDAAFESSERLRLGKWVLPDEREQTIASFIAAAFATVRKEEREAAFKAVRERIEATNPNLTFGSANGSVMKKCILMEIADLEQGHD